MRRILSTFMAGVIGLGAAACTTTAAPNPNAPDAGPSGRDTPKTAMVNIASAGAHKDKVAGKLVLKDVKGGVHVVGEITGLTPGKHGFHVHEKGDLSDPKLASAGGHFNPDKKKHGGTEGEERHAGDWGNITADEKGVAKIDATFAGVTLNNAMTGIVGRSIIVHAKEDDGKTDPAGNAGDRIAGGIVEFDKTKVSGEKEGK